MQQSSASPIGLQKILSLLLAVPSCIYSFWRGAIPTSYFIFILVSLIFYQGLALTVARGEMLVRALHVQRICTRMRIVRANNRKL